MLTSLFFELLKCNFIDCKKDKEHQKAQPNNDFKMIDLDVPYFTNLETGISGFILKVDKELSNIDAFDFARDYRAFVQCGNQINPDKAEIKVNSLHEISVLLPITFPFKHKYLRIYFEKFDGTDRKETQKYVLVNGVKFLKHCNNE